MTLIDPYVAIDQALSEDTRAAILSRFVPGAHVADVLDQSDDADENLELIEPAWEDWGDDVTSTVARATGTPGIVARVLVTGAMQAVILSGVPLAEDAVRDLASAAGHLMAA